jgi:hypothetical protein
MKIPGRWMKAPDLYLLEYLRDVEELASPTEIARDGRIPFTRAYINKRLRTLERHSMVLNVGNGMYRLTDRGSAWLRGEFDARTLDK